MARHRATVNGDIPFTPEEETQRDIKEAEYNANADARAASEVREKRDAILAATDWRASVDLTLSTEWANYRQALRDVPSQAGFPNTITWPSEPE